MLGEEVATLVSKKLNPGTHTFQFDGKHLASGFYYYQLVAGLFSLCPGQTQWIRYTENPVLGPGPSGDWDDVNVLAASGFFHKITSASFPPLMGPQIMFRFGKNFFF